MGTDWQRAASLALGVGETEEVRDVTPDAAFEAEFDAWSARFGAMLADLPEEPPPEECWRGIEAALGGPTLVRTADEGAWLTLMPGARLKWLDVDPVSGRRSAMLRLAAGTTFPAHDHAEIEGCLVLEGSIQIDGRTFGPGDYIIAPAGTRHRDIPSASGSLVLLHWSSAG